MTSGSPKLRRPREGGDPVARASERRWVPASAGTTVLCRKTAYAAYPVEDCYTVIGTQGSFGVPTMRVRCYDPGTDRSWYRPFVNRTVAFERKDPLAVQIGRASCRERV